MDTPQRSKAQKDGFSNRDLTAVLSLVLLVCSGRLALALWAGERFGAEDTLALLVAVSVVCVLWPGPFRLLARLVFRRGQAPLPTGPRNISAPANDKICRG